MDKIDTLIYGLKKDIADMKVELDNTIIKIKNLKIDII